MSRKLEDLQKQYNSVSHGMSLRGGGPGRGRGPGGKGKPKTKDTQILPGLRRQERSVA